MEAQTTAGIDFLHRNGATGERYMMETLSAGGGFLDYDADGHQDILLIQSSAVTGSDQPSSHRLYRNNADGTFSDQSAGSGLESAGYGMGACFGDIDNDGRIDIYITSFGTNLMFHNQGGGRFVDITRSSATGDDRWGMSCAFADYDQDGLLDLYVVNYVNFTLASHRVCGNPKYPTYCPPDAYSGVPDVLFHNLGDLRFEDATATAGLLNPDPLKQKGLGVVWVDLDDDGDADIYVANDATPNLLHRNNGDGSFTEVAVITGTAFNGMGVVEAGMGVDAGDFDGDGDLDLFVTHLDNESNTLYRNRGTGLFEDATDESGLGIVSLPDLGFGTGFFDYDNDGDLDLFVANGHINDLVHHYNPHQTYAQRDRLYENRDGRFTDASASSGPYFATSRVGRSVAFADIDNDGDMDVLVTHNNEAAVLLRNMSPRDGNWIEIRLASRFGGRDAIGARIVMTTSRRQLLREVHAGSGYLSQSDLRLHFALGADETIQSLEIRWPEGDTQGLAGSDIVLNQVQTLNQPQPGGQPTNDPQR